MHTGKTDISGWLVRHASWHAWLVLGVVLCAPVVEVTRRGPDGGMGNAIGVRAARTWLDGGSPYADPHFLHLPSAVLAAVPQAVLPTAVLRVLVPLTVTALPVVGWACALRIHGVGLRSRFAVLGLTALALGFAPFGHLMTLGNWTVTAVVALVLVPAVASGGAALVMPDPVGFFTWTLPFLLRGRDDFVRLHEASPGAVLAVAGWGCGVRTGGGGGETPGRRGSPRPPRC